MNIDAIKNTTDEELLRIWKELQVIQEIEFQYQEKSTAYELAPHLGILYIYMCVIYINIY